MSEEIDNNTDKDSVAGNAADVVADLAISNDQAQERPEDVPLKFWDEEKKAVRHDDVLKSYNELSSKFGAFTGSPDEYEAALSDELKEQGVELSEDDPLIETAKEFAKELNMNQEGFSKLLNLYGMTELAKATAEQEAIAADIASLGENADRRLNNLEQWASKNLPEDLQEGFKDLAVSADAVKALEQVVSMTRNAPVNVNDAETSKGVTEEEVKALQFAEDKHGNRLIQVDPAHKAKYERARKALYGEEPFNQVVR